MDIAQLIDIFLHLDKHLSAVVADFGPWVYALLFLIIFVETGLVVMPFLPGDSLLFVAGAIAGLGAMDLPLLMGLLTTAAILGDALYADAATQAQAPRLLLHASHLAFSHPATGTPVTLAWAEEFEENAASAPAFIAPEAIY